MSDFDRAQKRKVGLGQALDHQIDSIEAHIHALTPFRVATATTTDVIDGSGRFGPIRCEGGTLGNVTIYDGSTVLYGPTTPVKGDTLLDGGRVFTDLSIVTAAATFLTGAVLAD